VHEQGLVLALEEVDVEEREEEPLDQRQGGFSLVLVSEGPEEVDVRAKQRDQEVEEDRAQVLDDEDGTPGDLGACDNQSN
jgi:hypothetical protein